MRLALRHCRWLARLLGGVALSLAFFQAALPQPEPPPLAVEASFLLKFIPFIDWPDAAARDKGVTVCVTGDNPFAALLDRVVHAQPPGSPPVTIRRLSAGDSPRDCQILYLGGAPENGAAEALAATQGHPVLTVTDSSSASAGHGVINFIPGGDGVRFEIDMKEAAQKHLDISSKLLQIAAGVRPPE